MAKVCDFKCDFCGGKQEGDSAGWRIVLTSRDEFTAVSWDDVHAKDEWNRHVCEGDLCFNKAYREWADKPQTIGEAA